MATLIAVYNSEGLVGRCDARCYNADGGRCECICGGANHGKGHAKAAENVARQAREMIEAYEADLDVPLVSVAILGRPSKRETIELPLPI